MKSLHVTQQLRPIRFCFIIGTEKADLLEAISINTVLWGGVFNPIIRLGKSSSGYSIYRSLGVIKAFDPDLIINLSASLPESFTKQLERKIVDRGHFIAGGKGSKAKLEKGLNTYRAFQAELPEAGLTDKQKENFTIFSSTTAGLELLIAAQYGKIDKLAFPRAYDFLKESIEIPEKKLSQIELSKLKHNSPIGSLGITRFSLDEFGGRGSFSPHLVYVGSQSKIEDILEYWNLRAAGENILFLPIENYTDYEEVVKDFVKTYSEIKRFDHIDIDLQISPSLRKNSKEFEEVGEWIKTKTGIGLTRRLWLAKWGGRQKRIVEDISCVIPYHSREKNLVSYTPTEIDAFTLAYPKFIEEQFYREKHSWAVDLSFIGFYDRTYTIDLPNQSGMQEIAQHDLAFAGYDKVRVGERGLVILCDSKDDSIHINPVPVTKVVKKLFEKAGFSIEPSVPGIFANKILQIMGGLDRCRIFKVKGVREVLTKLNTAEGHVTVDGKRIKGIMAKSNPLQNNYISDIVKSTTEDTYGSKNWIKELYEDMTLYYGQPIPLTPEIVTNRLISQKLIMPGLKLTCVECTSEDWYKLGTFSDTFKCNYCFKVQDVPRIDRQPWFYKTEGMVSIADEGKGSIPVILSLWRLSNPSGIGEGKFVTSHNVKSIEGEFRAEFDYVYFTVGHFEKEMELVIGEARNYTDYSKKDITKVLTLAKKFKKKPFLAFTTLKDKFSDSEIELMKSVMKEGYFVLPISRMETDPYDLYDRFDKLKDPHAVTLEDLSVNLCQVNLGMAPADIYGLVEAEERARFQTFIKKLEEKREKAKKEAKVLKSK